MCYNSAADKALNLFMQRSVLPLLMLALCCAPLTAQEESDLSPVVAAAPDEPAAEETVEPEEVTEEAAEAADEEADTEPDDSDDTAAEALVATLKERFAALAFLLARVEDAESAQRLQPEVQQQFASLLSTDAAALADADEEELAAEFAEAFSPIDAELARLEESEFFGCDALRTVFADADESAESEESGYVFPLGPLDFLRSRKTEERHVCPRRESGLQLMDWSQN